MSIQFKSITELNELLDNKSISASELTQESIQLAKKYDELNEDYFLKVKKRYKSDFEKFNY